MGEYSPDLPPDVLVRRSTGPEDEEPVKLPVVVVGSDGRGEAPFDVAMDGT